MAPNDRPEFERLLDTIGDAMGAPDTRIDRARRIYFEHLQDIPIHRMREVATEAIRTLSRFPTINDLRGFAHAKDNQGQRNNELIEAERRLTQATIEGDTEYTRELYALIAWLKGEWRPIT